MSVTITKGTAKKPARRARAANPDYLSLDVTSGRKSPAGKRVSPESKDLGLVYTAGHPVNILQFANVYKVDSEGRIATAKAGVAAAAVLRIAGQMKWNQGDLVARLGLSKSTVNRKISQKQSLDVDQSERLVGLSRLIGQVQDIVDDAGNPEGFDAAAWLGRWLEKPNPALGGKLPWKYLDTMEGQSVIASLLNKIRSGAYA